jgi:hypothetical protein
VAAALAADHDGLVGMDPIPHRMIRSNSYIVHQTEPRGVRIITGTCHHDMTMRVWMMMTTRNMRTEVGKEGQEDYDDDHDDDDDKDDDKDDGDDKAVVTWTCR